MPVTSLDLGGLGRALADSTSRDSLEAVTIRYPDAPPDEQFSVQTTGSLEGLGDLPSLGIIDAQAQFFADRIDSTANADRVMQTIPPVSHVALRQLLAVCTSQEIASYLACRLIKERGENSLWDLTVGLDDAGWSQDSRVEIEQLGLRFDVEVR
jgi:hypothetical protein